MKTKKCGRCKQEKLLSEFWQHKSGKLKGNYFSYCKKCVWDRQRIYLIKNPWRKTYSNIITRCSQKRCSSYSKIKIKITSLELKELWFRDKAYLMKRPSVDRKDNKGDYTKENCRYIELVENRRRGSVLKMKPCKQLTLDGKLVKIYKSQTEASKQTGINQHNISSCIHGKNHYKTVGGYKWVNL